MQTQEKPELVFRRLITLIEQKRAGMPEEVYQQRIDKLFSYAVQMCRTAETKLYELESERNTSIDMFFSRCIVTDSHVGPPLQVSQRKGPGRPSSIDQSKPMVECSVAYAAYKVFVADAQPLEYKAFCWQMSQKGYTAKKVRGVGHYIGIRLRLPSDPLPRFPREVTATLNIIELGHAIMFSPPLMCSMTIERSVMSWLDARYERCDYLEAFLDAEVLHKAFLAEYPSDTVSLETFCRSTGGWCFESYPSEFRWLLPPNAEHTDKLWAEIDGCSPTRHLFESSKRRWLALRKREDITPVPNVGSHSVCARIDPPSEHVQGEEASHKDANQ